MSGSLRFIITFVLIICSAAPATPQERDAGSATTGSLHELRDKHRIWLIVRRGLMLDARSADASVISEVYKEVATPRQNFPRTYNMIARKLNKYMKEHRSLSAARTLGDADFIIFFNVLEIRRPLGTPYAYGELFIILNAQPKPRVLWKTRSSGMFVDDAMGDFISELKAVRGEK